MILEGPKDIITSLWTKGLKALVPPNSFGPPPMGGVGVDFKDRGVVYRGFHGFALSPGKISSEISGETK